ncbi:LptF/LptG family permease [Plectonema cf. radiosum LEGE 06105]|uniref:LptF/LptG family permease n=1 Tax=Plectonema cf. radiosum LEGE 06105 TaxID=945769 RepID=A0A8J7F4H2_9CYAN|nr:LptF/LptG family permease [Plectonema radiosum]MBE9216246.1 LptF/LptG family permease [Plectonema cf. radiosum LEGE 06105]
MAQYKSSHTSSLLPISIMDRYLTSEMVPPFLFGVAAFSSLGVSVGAVFELVRKVVESGLPIGIAARVFILNFPEFIVLAFPMSTLLATLMTYSRLSSQSELIALRSCGVSVYRMVATGVCLSFLVTGLTFVFNEQIAPAAKYQATQTMRKALNSEQPAFKRENLIYPEYKKVEQKDGSKQRVLARLFYADTFDGKQMKGLTIIDRSQEDFSQILQAESGEWNVKDNVWDFYDGTIYLISPDSSYRNIVRFERQQLKLPRTALDLAQESRDYGEMNIVQAFEQLELEKLGGDQQKIRKLQVRIQQKMSLPFVCVVFGLVGATMGSIPGRTGSAKSFGISVIIIFGYYLFSFITGGLAQAGVFSPFLGAWFPNFLGLGIGLFLLARVARR